MSLVVDGKLHVARFSLQRSIILFELVFIFEERFSQNPFLRLWLLIIDKSSTAFFCYLISLLISIVFYVNCRNLDSLRIFLSNLLEQACIFVVLKTQPLHLLTFNIFIANLNRMSMLKN